MVKVKFKIEGMKELQKSLKKLGEVPQKHVTSSARKGMNIILKGARSNAPVDTGDLKRGMKLFGEKSRFKGKKVYRIIFDPTMNDIFQKKNAEGEITGYYPISQEYGFFSRNGRYIPGYRFIHDSMAGNAKQMERIVVDTMKTKIDQEIGKAGLK
ncbi:HK97 gp10 family phage protein [Aminipila butyrica]|uniref:HK97 gp10 family phage protein n=1 Tax=Aminipila butyrica TaxID=433296 RepID=A0A858BTD3_9FIRM|nr:HK97-gp10 family putative phage morphogenesis protein [Aminipila butyrica]QIB68612.1 HK97 gp10 family phage protein [Aminipila butyrica]